MIQAEQAGVELWQSQLKSVQLLSIFGLVKIEEAKKSLCCKEVPKGQKFA